MKLMRLALTGSLLLVLAACGNNNPTPTPPTPTPPTAPSNPSVPPTQPPTAPDVPYYGEWAWSFMPNDGCCNEEGRFSIVQVRDLDPAGSGYGFYQKCYIGDCYDLSEGRVVYGPSEDNTLTITLFIVNSAGDSVVTSSASWL